MERLQKGILLGLAGACFVAVTQIVTLTSDGAFATSRALQLAITLFAVAIPVLVSMAYYLPQSKNRYFVLMLGAIVFAVTGLGATFFHFGLLQGVAFIVGVSIAAATFLQRPAMT